jgi:hypothetical protein
MSSTTKRAEIEALFQSVTAWLAGWEGSMQIHAHEVNLTLDEGL